MTEIFGYQFEEVDGKSNRFMTEIMHWRIKFLFVNSGKQINFRNFVVEETTNCIIYNGELICLIRSDF